MKALEISQITFSYDVKDTRRKDRTGCVLRDFSLQVQSGEMHALVGPNGAGKTTLMRLITGQLRGYDGDIKIYGRKHDDSAALSMVGYAPQPISVFPSLSAWENLRVFGVMAGLSDQELKNRATAVMEATGLLPYAMKRVTTFSGGMLRRLNLAVALLHSPRLLLLDEPTAGVDPQSRNNIYETLNALNAQGVAAVLCTHLMDEAQRLCSRVTVLDKGAVIFSGAMRDIQDLEKFFLEKTGRSLRDDA